MENYEEKLIEIINSKNIPLHDINVLIKYFPELKESEDEKIRKELIEYHKIQASCGGHNAPFHEKYVSWLEKQGEQNSKECWLKEFGFEQNGYDPVHVLKTIKEKWPMALEKVLYQEQKPVISDDVLREGIAHFGITQYQIDNWLKKYVDVEKQGEQKETLCDKCRREQPSHFCQDITALGRCALEHQSKQKPADKVEPKFKIEEEKWYVCTQTYVLRGKIVVIKGQTYQAEKDNVIKGEDGCLFVDRLDGKALDYFRIWTIEDAKDGDVLYHKAENGIEYIVMSKGINEHNNIDSYFRYTTISGFGIDIPSVLSAKYDSITPVTKEQRDTLFTKMKEAGYEWDAEKKELKKIEQKSAESTNDVYPETLDEAIDLYYYSYGNSNGYFENLSFLNFKDIVKTFVNDYGKQKPAWSEEDETRLINTIIMLKEGASLHFNKKDITKAVDWLKSLKDRVQPQPKQEWSEEDEQHLQNAIKCTFGDGYLSTTDWLKSIKGRIQSQHRWKQENTDDLTDFENAMMHIGGSFFGENAGLDPNDTNAIKEQANILLELVPKQEWSEEDEDKLNKIIDLVSNYINDEDPGDMTYEEHKNFYVKHIDWLKSLKDRMKGEINHDRQKTY